MKHLLYIIGIAFLLTLICSCENPDLQTDVINTSSSTALTDGSTDSLLIEINLEWPAKGLPPVSMQNIQRELSTAIFGNEATSTDINKVMEDYFSRQEKEYRLNINELKRVLPQGNDADGRYSWSETIEGNFIEAVNNMQSYLLYSYGYTGGAHGIDSEKGFTFDLSHGKRITESNLFIPEYKSALSKLLSEELQKAVQKDVYDMLFIKTIEPNGNFIVDTEGITYIYERYEIGPYVSGIVRVSVPWDKLEHILK